MNDSNRPLNDHLGRAAALDVRSIRPLATLRLRASAPALPHLRRPSFATEQYRSAGIQIAEHAEQLKARAAVLLVTSFETGAGKTLTALNLALSLANDTERRVLLLEGDVYRSRLKTYFEPTAEDRSDLLQVLQRTGRLADAISHVEDTRLDVLLAGGPHSETDLLT